VKTIGKGGRVSRRGINWSLRRMSAKLFEKNIIDKITYNLLEQIIYACNRAVHGFKINEENGETLYDTAVKLVAYFYNLRNQLIHQHP